MDWQDGWGLTMDPLKGEFYATDSGSRIFTLKVNETNLMNPQSVESPLDMIHGKPVVTEKGNFQVHINYGFQPTYTQTTITYSDHSLSHNYAESL